MDKNNLKQYSNEYKNLKLKSEGLAYKVDNEILKDQKTLEVTQEVNKNAKVEKDDKQSFEDFKTVYKDKISQKCVEDYGEDTNDKLWEDTAKEMFLQSKEYIPTEDTKTQGELEDKLEESKITETPEQVSNTSIRQITQAEKILLNIIKTVGDYELDDVLCETSPEGNIHIITKDGKDVCTVSRSKFAINGDDTELIDELRENGYWKEDLDESKNIEDTCIMCGSNNLNGCYEFTNNKICTNCGKKYSLQEIETKIKQLNKSKKTEDWEPENLELGDDGLPVLEKPYKMSWSDRTEKYQISSVHPYDLTDYYFATSTGDDYMGYWRINSPEGQRVDIVEGYEEAVEALKEFDSKLTPHIDHT